MNESPLPQRRWATLPMLARHRRVSERSARVWASRGHFPLYRVPKVRGVVVDLDEADACLDALAEKGVIRPDHGTFGGQQITAIAEAVTQ